MAGQYFAVFIDRTPEKFSVSWSYTVLPRTVEVLAERREVWLFTNIHYLDWMDLVYIEI